MAGQWRYFLTRPDRLEEGYTMVYRLREGAPLLSLEIAGSTEWSSTDQMYRMHYLGSTDDEFHEVDRERAAAVLQHYFDIGYFSGIPDLDAPGPEDDFIAAAQQADDQADAVWRDVPIPPGVEDIGR